MRILIISPSNEGTIAKCSANLYKAFNSRGIDTRIACLYRINNGEESLDGCEYFIDRTQDEKANKGLLKKVMWVRKLKKKYHPSITISTLVVTNILNVLSSGGGVKVGIFHSPIYQAKELGRLYYVLTYLTYLLIFPWLNHLFCVSREVKRSLDSVITIPKRKSKVVYNAHNKEDVSNKSRLSIEDDVEKSIFSKDVLLYCGRIDENKAPMRAINAFCKAEVNESSQLVIIGPDPFNLWTRYKERIPDSFKGRIHYLGNKCNPYPYISKSKALISSSYSEGLPGVIIESLLLGRPVVTTSSSEGIWEIFSHSDAFRPVITDNYVCECGVITPNTSQYQPEQYYSDISCLAKGISTVMSMKEPVRFDFESEITFDSIVEKYLDIVK